MKCIIRRSVLKQTGMTVAALALPTRKTLGFERQSSARGEAPDYTSDVPKFTFADTLEEQEAQLKTNPIILRFVEPRGQRRCIATQPGPGLHAHTARRLADEEYL